MGQSTLYFPHTEPDLYSEIHRRKGDHDLRCNDRKLGHRVGFLRDTEVRYRKHQG